MLEGSTEKEGRSGREKERKKEKERETTFTQQEGHGQPCMDLDVNVGKASGGEAGGVSAPFQGDTAVGIPPSPHGSRKANASPTLQQFLKPKQ